jgi:hypothetical protein
MSITLGLQAIVAVVGGVVYLASTNAKVAELGRLSFACGALAFLLGFGR